MSQYSNVYFHDYVNSSYDNHKWFKTDIYLLKVLQALPRLIWDVMQDAFLELLFLLILLLVFLQMSQGKDLIISFFEPKGNYGFTRIFFTTSTIILYAVSMWIVPAFMFEMRDKNLKSWGKTGGTSLFAKHLFFVHRVLPMFVFWGMAVVFHPQWEIKLYILSACVLQFVLITSLFNPSTPARVAKFRRPVIGGYLIILLVLFGYLSVIFQDEYFMAKLVYSSFLVVLSFVMYGLFFSIDEYIVATWKMKINEAPIRKYLWNSVAYLGIMAVIILSVLLVVYAFNHLDVAPESLLLLIFSFYVFLIDFIYYIYRISRKTRLVVKVGLAAAALIYLLHTPSFNLSHLNIDYSDRKKSPLQEELYTIDQYYECWRERIYTRKEKGKPYPIFLVSGEGGGSRAGFWFLQSMMNLDSLSRGNFKEHVFSVSTVSGSTVGAAALYSYWWYKTKNPIQKKDAWATYPRHVFSNNFTSRCVYGLLLGDLWKSLYPWDKWIKDRNSYLQEQEAISIQRALYELKTGQAAPELTLCNQEGSLPKEEQEYVLKKDFLSFFYEKNKDSIWLKTDLPLLFINTTRSSDARRGIISPICLESKEFPDAIDVTRFIYCRFKEDTRYVGLHRAIDLGAACNTSELFPFLSAPAMIKGLGYFVDGGYHDNSGLKTTMDVQSKLVKLLNKDGLKEGVDYAVYMLYFKNGWTPKKYYPEEVIQGMPALQPLTTLLGAPFSGSASYFEEKAAITGDTNFINFALDYKLLTDTSHAKSPNPITPPEIMRDLRVDPKDQSDTLINLPLARWISNTVMRRMSHYSLNNYGSNQRLKKIITDISKE